MDDQSVVPSEDVNNEDSSIRENKDEKNDMEIDTIASTSKEDENKIAEEPEKVDAVHSISDESNLVGSDIDELHLLQKLHSGNEINSSTLESSDTDTPIDISDTLQSSSDNKRKQTSDVISIENSSYSETDANKDNQKEDDMDRPVLAVIAEEHMEETVEEMVKAVTPSPKKRTDQTNNDEYNDSVENILLASSDDEPEETKDASPVTEDMSVNLKDDAISIGDTVVEGEANTNDISDKEARDKNDSQNDDSSPEIILISQEVKEADIPLKSIAMNDKSNDSTCLSTNAVHTLNDCKMSVSDEKEVTNTVSKTTANSEGAMQKCDISNSGLDSEKLTESTKENNESEKENHTFETSTDVNNDRTETVIDKNDIIVENTTDSNNDNQETVDILISEIRSNLESIEALEVPASILQNNEL